MTLEKAIAAFEQFTDLLPEENYFELEYWIDEIEDYFEKFRR